MARLRSIYPMVRMASLLLALYGALAFYFYERTAAPLPDHVEGTVRVIDADTFDIAGKRIRLVDIDAPEIDQTCGEDRSHIWLCGQSAADAMKRYVGQQTVRCDIRGYDRHRRLLAICALPDGSQINRWAVRDGWALAYSLGDAYEAEEREASVAKRGIWSSTFIRPSEWRAQGYHETAFYTGD